MAGIDELNKCAFKGEALALQSDLMSKTYTQKFNDMKEMSDVIASMIRLGVISAICLLAFATGVEGGLYDTAITAMSAWFVKLLGFVVAFVTGLLSIAFAMLIVRYCGERFRSFLMIARLVESHPRLYLFITMLFAFMLLVVMYVLAFVGIVRILPHVEMEIVADSLRMLGGTPYIIYEGLMLLPWGLWFSSGIEWLKQVAILWSPF